MIWLVVAVCLFLAWRYVVGTNEKWILMNNIILAKLTYQRLSALDRRSVDQALRKRLSMTPGWNMESPDSLPGEEVKWRFYSLALADAGFHPLHDSSLRWMQSSNVLHDVKRAESIYKFDERLREGRFSEPHLANMR